MKDLSKKNKIIIGVCLGLLIIIIGLVIGFAVKKNKNNEPVKNNTDVRSMLSSASKLEVNIEEDKKVELTNLGSLDTSEVIKLWAFSDPIYLGEFTLISEDGKHYIEGIEEILNSKYITSGNHQILILQDDKAIGYFNISLANGTLLSSKEMSSEETSKDNETLNEDSSSKNNNDNKDNKDNNGNNDNKDHPANNTVNKDNNSNDHQEETTTTKEVEVLEDIKFKTEEIKETNMLKGKKETVEVGENGQKKITYKVTYDKNNKEIKREKISEVVVKEVKNAKVKVGLSDYNLNDKPTYEISTGLYCFEEEAKERNYKECDDVAGLKGDYQSVTVGNKEYLICLDDNCYDYYDLQFKLSSYPKVSKYQGMSTATLNGTKYFLDMRAGRDGNVLDETICTKLGLVCNRW